MDQRICSSSTPGQKAVMLPAWDPPPLNVKGVHVTAVGTARSLLPEPGVQATLTGSGSFTLNGSDLVGTFSGTLTQSAEAPVQCTYQFVGLIT
jgi:hypothetical protein